MGKFKSQLKAAQRAGRVTERKAGLKPGWAKSFVPKLLPAKWQVLQENDDGAWFVSTTGLRVVLSAALEQDKRRWLHISVSKREALPSWEDLKEVKSLFIGDDRTAIQVFPPKAQWVNIHPNTLHLWTCLDGDVLPDFTNGTSSI